MITISLSPELESTIAKQARQSGVTPEALIVESLREQFLAAASEQTIAVESVKDSETSLGADFLLSMAAMFESGTGDTSEDHRAIVAAEMGRKHGL